MKLHSFLPSPNSQKVLLVNALTGNQAQPVSVDIFSGVQKQPEFLALNPNGRVPVLEMDDGSTLWESNVICNRLAGLAGSPLWPEGDARYDILRWQMWEGCHLTPAATPFAAKYIFGDESVDLDAAAKGFHPFAKVLDDHLEGRDWLVGAAMTTADISVAMLLGLRHSCHMPTDGYANILAWLGRIEALPEHQAMVVPLQPEAA